jgi:hypothetical protein
VRVGSDTIYNTPVTLSLTFRKEAIPWWYEYSINPTMP